MAKVSDTRFFLRPEQVRPFSDPRASLTDLETVGVSVSQDAMFELREAMHRGYVMDSAPGYVTQATAGAPVQFLQRILQKPIMTATAARKADQLIGRDIVGEWHDESIVQPVVEPVGRAGLYGDAADVPLVDILITYEERGVVRFEEGVQAGVLTTERTQAMGFNESEIKRAAATDFLGIEMNRVAFYGYNGDGERPTYGMLNDPNLHDYITLPKGADKSSELKRKTFAEITRDFTLLASTLRVQSGERVDPEKDAITLALASSVRDCLNVTNEHGVSVRKWLYDTYPNWKIESAPELDNANGGAHVIYLYAQEVSGVGGEENKERVFSQLVPMAFRLVGMERKAKGTIEVYSNATAGSLGRLPFAVVRASGA